MCILSCVTNFLTSCAEESSSVCLQIKSVLLEVRDVLYSSCEEQPELQLLLCPPMYRLTPLWYRDGAAEVLLKFAQVFRDDKPRNLHLLASFPVPKLEADEVHLTPFLGLEFVMHLFDSADMLLDSLKSSSDSKTAKNTETIR